MNWGCRHVKARKDILEQAQAIRAGMKVSARYLPDEVAVEQPAGYFDEWAAGTTYERNDKIMRNGQLYNVEQPVTAEEHRPPEAEGMLAIYRPINVTAAGTLEDPIPFVYGMDCENGKYYSYENEIYLCKGDMKPCTWVPGTPGVHQWEKVTA